MIRAALSRRVSTQEQADSRLGLDSQLALARGLCDRLGFVVVSDFADKGVSASVPIAERPQGRLLTEAIARGEIDVVVALDMSRLFRDVIDCLSTLRRWHEQGVRLILVDGGEIGVDDPDSLLTTGIRALIDEVDRLRIRKRTRRALDVVKAQGRHRGRVPFGSRSLVRVEGGKRVDAGLLAPVEIEQGVLAQIRVMRERQMTYREIAAELDRLCVPTPRGAKQWWPESVRVMLKGVA